MEETPQEEQSIVTARAKFIRLARDRHIAPEDSTLAVLVKTLEECDPDVVGTVLLQSQDFIFSAPAEFREALKDSGLLGCEFPTVYGNTLLVFKQKLESLTYVDILQKMINKPIAEKLISNFDRISPFLLDLKPEDFEDFVNKVNNISQFDVDKFYKYLEELFKQNVPVHMDEKYWRKEFSGLHTLDPKAFKKQLKVYLENQDVDSLDRAANLVISYPKYFKDILPLLTKRPELIQRIMVLKPEYKSIIIESKILDKIKDAGWKLTLNTMARQESTEEVFDESKKVQSVLAKPATKETELRYRKLSILMTGVIQQARAELNKKGETLEVGKPAKIILEDPNNKELPYNKPYGTNGKIEIRFFKEGDNNSITIEDINTRIDFLGRVAKQLNPNADQKEIDKIIETYKLKCYDKFGHIDEIHSKAIGAATIKDKAKRKAVGEAFKDMATDVRIMFLELQKELVKKALPKASLSDGIDKLDKQAKDLVIAEGRPTIIHVDADGNFNAQIPKGDKTYPTNYRGSEEAKVSPNSVLELIGIISDKTKDKVTVQSGISRASSFSVLKMKARRKEAARQRLNYLNGLEDVRNLIKTMNVPPGEKVTIHWHTLLTPLLPERMARGGITGKLFPSETRQVRDQHRVLEMLNILEAIDGHEIEITHMNTSVRSFKDLMGKADEVSQDRVNNKGMVKYIQRQVKAMKELYKTDPELTKWLDKYCPIESALKSSPVLEILENRLKGEYRRLAMALRVAEEGDLREPDSKLAKEIRENIKDIEDKLMKEYAEVAKGIRDIWAQDPPPPVPQNYKGNAHVMYFADVLNMYYSGRSKESKGFSYLFVAEMQRTDEFVNVITAENCKSAKDRTKDAVDHSRMLLMYENEYPGRFLLSTSKDPDVKQYMEEHYQSVRRQGVGMAAIGKNLPGVRSSAKNNPWGDKFDTDSLVHDWGSIKPKVTAILRYWFHKAIGKNTKSQKVLDLLSETRAEDFRIYNINLLRNLDNKMLALAMMDLLTKKGVKISENADDVRKAVEEINKEILSNTVMPLEFLQKYKRFLEILDKHNISAINDVRGPFIVAIVMGNNSFTVKTFSDKPDKEKRPEMKAELKQLEKHCEHLRLAIEELPNLMGDASSVEVDALKAQLAKLEPEREKLRELVKKTKPHVTLEESEQPTADLSFSVGSGPVEIARKAIEITAEESRAYILYNPNTGKFTGEFSDEERIQRLNRAEAHLIELTKTQTETQVSYTEPPKGKKLDDAELEKLVNKMLDEILKKCEPGKYEDIVLSGSNDKMVKMAKELLPKKIAELKEAAPQVRLDDHHK